MDPNNLLSPILVPHGGVDINEEGEKEETLQEGRSYEDSESVDQDSTGASEVKVEIIPERMPGGVLR